MKLCHWYPASSTTCLTFPELPTIIHHSTPLWQLIQLSSIWTFSPFALVVSGWENDRVAFVSSFQDSMLMDCTICQHEHWIGLGFLHYIIILINKMLIFDNYSIVFHLELNYPEYAPCPDSIFTNVKMLFERVKISVPWSKKGCWDVLKVAKLYYVICWVASKLHALVFVLPHLARRPRHKSVNRRGSYPPLSNISTTLPKPMRLHLCNWSNICSWQLLFPNKYDGCRQDVRVK